ncbi:MAG: LemA family protein [Deltaproteobacteria bacterium]|jgi:LemA protein|nr:LemA family protein [Deltaproteobacteria bacterium]
MNIIFACLTIILVSLTLLFIYVYNRLVILRTRCRNAFSQIDVQLKRRFDLVPNLVEGARAYLAHEKHVLEQVTTLRAEALKMLSAPLKSKNSLPSASEISLADLALVGATNRLTALMENYPNLKADQTILSLMEDLKSAENRISYARQAYNDAVMEYNQTLDSFPAVMFAPVLSFEPADLWWSDQSSKTAAPVEGRLN